MRDILGFLRKCLRPAHHAWAWCADLFPGAAQYGSDLTRATLIVIPQVPHWQHICLRFLWAFLMFSAVWHGSWLMLAMFSFQISTYLYFLVWCHRRVMRHPELKVHMAP